MNFNEWLDLGIKNSWIGNVVCYTHEGPEMTEEEALQWDDGEDPCIFIIRVWE